MKTVRACAVMGLFSVMAALTGCAAPAEDEGGVAPSLSEVAGGVAGETAIQGETITLNCGSSLPGFPKPPCLPDLVHTQLYTEIVAPGGNLAPGYYIHFQFKNDSAAAAGPFSVRVTDQLGATLNTYAYSGLGAGASNSLVVYAPYNCGWSRKVELDSGNTVVEANESNNARTSSYACQRAY